MQGLSIRNPDGGPLRLRAARAEGRRLPTILAILVVGIVATLAMDAAWALGIALKVFRTPPIGRWAMYILKGKPRQADIEKAPAVKGEAAVSLPAHYVTGIVLAVPYLFLLDWFPLDPGNVLVATVYGLVTSLVPLLIMLPFMGYGLFGMGRTRDTFWLRQILVIHLAYGAGIGIALRLFFPA